MIHVLKHVESITQHRDRSLLELGVASALFELVKAKEVNLYKVQAEDSGRFLERVTHVGQDGLRFNSEFEPGNDLIPVSDRPEMRACVEEAQIVRRHDEAAGLRPKHAQEGGQGKVGEVTVQHAGSFSARRRGATRGNIGSRAGTNRRGRPDAAGRTTRSAPRRCPRTR